MNTWIASAASFDSREMHKPFQHQIFARMFWGLVAITVLVRLPLWIWYVPVTTPDSGTYLSMARVLESWKFAGYVGARPPIYSMLLVLFGESPTLIWAMQSALGILTVFLTFDLAFRCGARPSTAFLAGLAVTLSVNLLLFEAGLLTEAVSTFALTLAFWLLARGAAEALRYKALRVFLACGSVCGVCALTKPFLQLTALLVPLLAAYLTWSATKSFRRSGAAFAAVSVPALALILGWCVFNKVHLDYFGVSTLAGYSLTQHAGAVMEYAPVDYAPIRDIYLKYREARVVLTGTHSMTIWDAYPEMMQRTGLGFVALSKELGRLSMSLLLSHPGSYAETAIDAWVRFWKAPLTPAFLVVEEAPKTLLGILDAIWHIERYLLVASKGLFLVLLSIALVKLAWKRQPENLMGLAVGATIVAASVLQALTEYGENARYSLPFQPLIFAAIAMLLPGRPEAMGTSSISR